MIEIEANSSELRDRINLTILSALFFISAVVSYYFLIVSKKPKIYCSNKKFKRFLVENVPIVKEKFFPSIFYWEGRLQSIFALSKRIPNSQKLPFNREIFKLKDGGELALDYLEEKSNTSQNQNETENGRERKEKFICLFLPGITSNSQTSYCKTFMLAIQKAGADTIVCFNNRGLGGVPLKTPRLFSGSNYEDLREVILYLRSKYPNDRIYCVGASMGGILLCHYLTEHPEEAKACLEGTLIVSIVWDVNSGSDNIEKNFINRKIFNKLLAMNLMSLVKRNRKVLEQSGKWDLDYVLSSNLLKEFDRRFMVPQFNHKSVADYYDTITVNGKINKFSIPVFSVNSLDDPLQPAETIPIKEAVEDGSNLSLIILNKGGHLGFLEGLSMKKDHYIERFIFQFISAVKQNGPNLISNCD